jgi:serine/threonine-protein kinase
MGTPSYMAPEQAAGVARAVGPAADVYALGAVLYELLTGRPPFLAATAVETLHQVLHTEPVAPVRLQPGVPRDLETICLTCLRKEARKRYTSAAALADDLRRFLEGRPITARRTPAWERAGKWARRRPAAAALIAVTALAAVALAALGYRHQRSLEQHNRDLTEANQTVSRERDAAVKARNRTREALAAMISGVTSDALATQKELTAEQRTFLESVVPYYEELAAEPGEDRAGRERLAEVRFRLAAIRYRLGQRELAAVLFREAADHYRRLAADFADTPKYRSAQARSDTNRGIALRDLGRRAEAESAHYRALAVLEPLAAAHPTVAEYRNGLARSHHNLGTLLDDLGKRTDAEAAYGRALTLWEQLAADFPNIPEYRRDLANSHGNLAGVLRHLGQSAEAESAQRAALALRERLAADFPQNPDYRYDVAVTQNGLGDLLESLGKWAEAESAYRQALTVHRQLVADFPAVPDYRSALAGSHNDLAGLLRHLGRAAEAESAYRDALAIRERLAADFPNAPAYKLSLAGGYANFGSVLSGQGQPGPALDWFAKAIRTLNALLRREPLLARAREYLRNAYVGRATALGQLHSYPDALADWDHALDYDDGSTRAVILLGRAGCLARAGLRATAAADAVPPPPTDTTDTYDAACVLARTSAAVRDDAAAADRHAARAVAVLRQALAKGYADVASLVQDRDLDPLRKRDDFAAVLWDLADRPARVKGAND